MKEPFDALNKDTSIFGHRFLEASAGTGKTFSIEHLFVRLILESGEETPITCEQILVVTFTKAATRELKHRIRTNIERALIYLKKGGSSSSIFKYLASHLKNRAAATTKLREALHLFDQAQIFTIHGFCYTMACKICIRGRHHLFTIRRWCIYGYT